MVAFANPYLEAPRNQPTFASALRGNTFINQARSSPNSKRPVVLPQAVGTIAELQSSTTPNTPPAAGAEGDGSGAAATGGSVTSKSAISGQVAVTSPKKKVRDPRTGKGKIRRVNF